LERLENRCLLAVMADGVMDADVPYTDDELAMCECAPGVLDEEFVTVVGDASERIEGLAAEPVWDDGSPVILEQPYFVDEVVETEDSFLDGTLDDGAAIDESFITMIGAEEGDWTDGEWVESEVVTFDGEVFTGVTDEFVEGAEFFTEVIDVVDESAGEIFRGENAASPVDEVLGDPYIVTMLPAEDSELADREVIEEPAGEVDGSIVVTVEEAPTGEADEPVIVTLDSDATDDDESVGGDSSSLEVEAGPVLTTTTDSQRGHGARRQRELRLQRGGHVRRDSALLAVVDRDEDAPLPDSHDNELVQQPQHTSQVELESLDTAFSRLRVHQLIGRLGGLG
jgi:hypothetical protein